MWCTLHDSSSSCILFGLTGKHLREDLRMCSASPCSVPLLPCVFPAATTFSLFFWFFACMRTRMLRVTDVVYLVSWWQQLACGWSLSHEGYLVRRAQDLATDRQTWLSWDVIRLSDYKDWLVYLVFMSFNTTATFPGRLIPRCNLRLSWFHP